MVNVSMVEGKGPYTCTDSSHPPHITNDLTEHNKHLLTHGYYGVKPCPICGTPVRNLSLDKLVPNGKSARCEDCKKEDY
jgi:hypothetical protein